MDNFMIAVAAAVGTANGWFLCSSHHGEKLWKCLLRGLLVGLGSLPMYWCSMTVWDYFLH